MAYQTFQFDWRRPLGLLVCSVLLFLAGLIFRQPETIISILFTILALLGMVVSGVMLLFRQPILHLSPQGIRIHNIGAWKPTHRHRELTWHEIDDIFTVRHFGYIALMAIRVRLPEGKTEQLILPTSYMQGGTQQIIEKTRMMWQQHHVPNQ